MTVDPLAVPSDDKDGGVADVGVGREGGQETHDEGYDFVVGGVDLGAHRTH